MDVSLFVPAIENQRTTEVARKVCRGCTEAEACLSFAVPLPQLRGVWAGTSSEERRRLRRLASIPTSTAFETTGPTDEELAGTEVEELDELLDEGPAAGLSSVEPSCVVCDQPLPVDRQRMGAKTHSGECQRQHKRDVDRSRKDRAAGNGKAATALLPLEVVPSSAVTPAGYPPDGAESLFAELLSTVRRHPSASVSAKLGGVRITLKAGRAS